MLALWLSGQAQTNLPSSKATDIAKKALTENLEENREGRENATASFISATIDGLSTTDSISKKNILTTMSQQEIETEVLKILWEFKDSYNDERENELVEHLQKRLDKKDFAKIVWDFIFTNKKDIQKVQSLENPKDYIMSLIEKDKGIQGAIEFEMVDNIFDAWFEVTVFRSLIVLLLLILMDTFRD